MVPHHVSTLHAFGYVSASKQDKQFMTCHIPAADTEEYSETKVKSSPGSRGEYAAIVSMNGQVFIYKSPEPVEGCELKNRKTGQVRPLLNSLFSTYLVVSYINFIFTRSFSFSIALQIMTGHP